MREKSLYKNECPNCIYYNIQDIYDLHIFFNLDKNELLRIIDGLIIKQDKANDFKIILSYHVNSKYCPE